MSTWAELLPKLQELQKQGRTDAFDMVRREALSDLHSYTGRNVILYASGHLQKPTAPPELLTITNEDIEGFMEVFHGMSGATLDLILHSPGGRAEATEALVKYLRSKFQGIRAFIPLPLRQGRESHSKQQGKFRSQSVLHFIRESRNK